MNTTNTTPVVFLDFDGVLIAEDGTFSQSAIFELGRLLHDTGASIVFITSLRYRFGPSELQAMLVSNGLDPETPVEEVSPSLADFRDAVRNGRSAPGFRRRSKGEEISAFLMARPDLDRWMIIDDQPHACAPYQSRTAAPRGVFNTADRLRAMALFGQ